MAGWGTPTAVRPGVNSVFVPNGDSRQETAILLVGTADEYGIDQRSIRAVSGGFYVSDELASVLYDESDEQTDEALASEESPTTSGNRAAKNTSTTVTDKE